MYSTILSVGDKVDFVAIGDLRAGREDKRYASQIIEVQNEKTIDVLMPIDKGRLITMETGLKYDMCFYTKRGLYRCTCIVENRYKQNNIVAAVMKPLTALEKFQRRQYYRLECLMDILYRVVSKQETLDQLVYEKDLFETQLERYAFYKKLSEYEESYDKAVLMDISGGGVRFFTKTPLAEGERVLLKIDLMDGAEIKPMRLAANIVISSESESKAGRHENRAEFTDLSKEDRELIIRFVFEEERKKRKKEMG